MVNIMVHKNVKSKRRKQILFGIKKSRKKTKSLSPYTVFKERVGENNENKSLKDKIDSYWSLLVWCSLFN